jgi:ABC-type glycerol-3-phosphate transport system permease component
MMENFRNGLIVVVGTILLVLIVGAHAGYAAARFHFRGREALLFAMLSTMMLPGIATVIPQYLLASKLGLYDTRLVLILVYSAWQLPSIVWIMRGFFLAIPRELEESARVDGCSYLGAFYRVVLPLAWPGLGACAVLVFVWVWNEFILALNLTLTNHSRPLSVGLYFFIGEAGIDWGRITAFAAVAAIPVVVAFLFLQRTLMSGLTEGALKG